MPLDLDEQIHLTAAEGFIGLKMYFEADEELEAIDPFCQHLPEVLVVRLEIYRALERWELMQAVAKKLAEEEPANVEWWLGWSEGTRRADSLDAGRRILVNALEDHDNSAFIHYRLACYECELGEIGSAKLRLKKCFEIDPTMRLKALGEEDLAPLWEED